MEWKPGTLEAVSRDAQGAVVSRDTIETAEAPARILLSAIQNPEGFRADGADIALLQFEVVDEQGRRCPLDNRMVNFTVEGSADWRGGIAQGPDNFILAKSLPVECGVNRALVRSTTEPGDIKITASAWDLPDTSITLTTIPADNNGGLSNYMPSATLKGRLGMGPTPEGPSYKDRLLDIPVKSIEAGSNQVDVLLTRDDNEKS